MLFDYFIFMSREFLEHWPCQCQSSSRASWWRASLSCEIEPIISSCVCDIRSFFIVFNPLRALWQSRVCRYQKFQSVLFRCSTKNEMSVNISRCRCLFHCILLLEFCKSEAAILALRSYLRRSGLGKVIQVKKNQTNCADRITCTKSWSVSVQYRKKIILLSSCDY